MLKVKAFFKGSELGTYDLMDEWGNWHFGVDRRAIEFNERHEPDYFNPSFNTQGPTIEDFINTLGEEALRRLRARVNSRHRGGGFADFASADQERNAHREFGQRPFSFQAPPPHRPSAEEQAAKRLGVAWPCSAEELKKAYRASALKTHPDHGGNSEAFRAVAEDYKFLNRRTK